MSEKREVIIDICLNTNQPAYKDYSQYNFYVYDTNGDELDDFWKGDLLYFQCFDLVGDIRKEFNVIEVNWIGLDGEYLDLNKIEEC